MKNLRFLTKSLPLLCIIGCFIITSCSSLKTGIGISTCLNYSLTVELLQGDDEQALMAVFSGVEIREVIPVTMNTADHNLLPQRIMVSFNVEGVNGLSMLKKRLSASGLRVVDLVKTSTL